MNDESPPKDERDAEDAERESERERDRETDPAAERDSDLVSERDAERESEPESQKAPPALPPKLGLPVALWVTILSALAIRYAFHADQAGQWSILFALFGLYAPLSAFAVYLIHKEGKVHLELKPRSGDLAFGSLIAMVMYVAGMGARQFVLHADSPRNWWLARIYLQLGDTANNRMLYVGMAIFVIAVLEEIVWRGLVMRSLSPAFGPARAWLFSSVLYAVAHVSTIGLLSHPVAGPNPLIVAAALGCGLVWGHLYNRTGRLAPSLFAHGLFSMAIVDFPLWRP